MFKKAIITIGILYSACIAFSASADTGTLTWGALPDIEQCDQLEIARIEGLDEGASWNFNRDKFDKFACDAPNRVYDIGDGVRWVWRIRRFDKSGLKSSWSNVVSKTGAPPVPVKPKKLILNVT